MKAWGAAAATALLAGCGWISFRKPPTDDELRVERELRAYYTQVKSAFAVGNSQALAALFDTSITRPMTKPDIESWGEKFFGEHGRARFILRSFSLDEMGAGRAVTTIRYRVETPDGKGSFDGMERDELIKKGGRWYTVSWEKILEGR